jgi:hypothetical protein
MLATQQAQTQFALAAKFARMNADNAKSVAQLVEAGAQNLQKAASTVAGLGQNVDISV